MSRKIKILTGSCKPTLELKNLQQSVINDPYFLSSIVKSVFFSGIFHLIWYICSTILNHLCIWLISVGFSLTSSTEGSSWKETEQFSKKMELHFLEKLEICFLSSILISVKQSRIYLIRRILLLQLPGIKYYGALHFIFYWISIGIEKEKTFSTNLVERNWSCFNLINLQRQTMLAVYSVGSIFIFPVSFFGININQCLFWSRFLLSLLKYPSWKANNND